MATSSGTVKLKIGDAEVARLDMPSGCAEVLVGRSRLCALKAPADEHSVSGKHARLFWRGGALYIEDVGSRNGVVYRGKPIKKACKVSSGDLFTLGNCTLVFSAWRGGKSKAKSAAAYHRLEWLNGSNAGKTVDINPKAGGTGAFSIGLDPGNDLCLADMLVSRRHASLEVKAGGECWIRDLGSRNGTYVNGEPLHGKERLLRDGDKISIAYFEFRFLDKSISHTRFHLWVKMMAVVGAVAAMSAVYVLWATARATVEDYLGLARKYAAAESFPEARAALRAAVMARDAEKFRLQIDTLDVQLERWEKTCADWSAAKSALAGSRWSAARRLVDQLNTGVMDAWSWNGVTAARAKGEAELAGRGLRVYYDAVESLSDMADGQPERQAERISGRLEPLKEFVAAEKDAFAEFGYLAPLTNRLASLRQEMERVAIGFEKVDGCINRLDAVNPDFKGLARELEAIQGDETANATVRAYARKYAVPCRELAVAKSFIESEYNGLTEMTFEDVRNKKDLLRLPDKMLCARHPKLSDHRDKLLRHHGEAQRYAAALGSMVSILSETVFADGAACGVALKSALSQEAWNRAFAFDCLGKVPPSARRKEPAGDYDEMVGVEYAYESLRALPEAYNGRCLSLVGFVPKIKLARQALEQVEAFVAYMDEQRQWLRKGKLLNYLEKCRKILALRDAIVKSMGEQAGSERVRVLAAFCANYLSATPTFAERQKVADMFKALQAKVSKLNEEYEAESDPVRQIAIRDRILAEGFPGDAAVHSKWVQKFDGGDR